MSNITQINSVAAAARKVILKEDGPSLSEKLVGHLEDISAFSSEFNASDIKQLGNHLATIGKDLPLVSKSKNLGEAEDRLNSVSVSLDEIILATDTLVESCKALEKELAKAFKIIDKKA